MIDLRTFLVLLAVADLLVAAALWIGVVRGSREGLSHWACALVVRALAGVVFLAGAAHAEGAVAVASGLLALSFTLQGAALLAFAHRALPAWIHTAAIAAVALPVQLVERDASLALLYAGTVMAVVMLGVAAIAIDALEPGAGRRLMAGSFAVAGVATLLRSASAPFEVDPAASLAAPSGFAGAALLMVFAAMLAATLSLLMLHKERAESHAERAGNLDPLTGAFTRQAFESLAGQALRRAQHHGEPLSLVMMDLDHFGEIVQRHGPAAADALLVRFVDMVRSTLRQDDSLVRFGADEFVVLLPGIAGPGAVAVAGRLRRMVAAEPLEAGAHDIPVTVSIGLSARIDDAPDEEETVGTLMERASAALQLAKRRGRDRVVALSLGSSLAA